jgi:Alginate lyase
VIHQEPSRWNAASLAIALTACASAVDGSTEGQASTGGARGTSGAAGALVRDASPGMSAGAGGGDAAPAGEPDVAGPSSIDAQESDAQPSGTADAGFSGTFRHPGALINAEQIAFLKAKIMGREEPWASAFEAAKASSIGSLSFKAHPFADVKCSTASASPDGSCETEKENARAAYTDALIWALSGDSAHAAKAIEILNAWSRLLKSHTNSNTPLQCGWVGTVFARAAELIRHTGAGWAQQDIDQFGVMLRTAFLPNLVEGAIRQNGNWEMSVSDALIQIAVFLDDEQNFRQALMLWRRRVPAYIYMKSDGTKPIEIPGQGADWYGPAAWVDGFAQETCRDMMHTQWAFGAMINVAETALIQGVDLYAEEAPRIVAGLELHAGFLDHLPYPAGICNDARTGSPRPTWEIAYNHYATRLGMSLPNTAALLKKPGFRPTDYEEHLAWETLTHAGVGNVGIH